MASISVREIGAADRPRFDRVVASATYPDFLQTWAWGDLKASTGWVPIRLLFTREGTDVAALSILERRIPLLGNLHYAPRGPMVNWADTDVVRACLDAAVNLGRRRGALALKLDPGVPAADWGCERQFNQYRFHTMEIGDNFESVQPRFVMQLPLQNRTTEDIMASFHPKTRYNIRLAERRGVRVRLGSRTDLPAFYEVLRETAQRDQFVVRSLSYFEAMYTTCIETGIARLWMAEAPDRQLLGGAIAFQLGGVTWYLYGASRTERRDLMAAYAVQWAMIRWAIDSGCRLYDFRGVSGDLRPENPLYGLYRFKKGFGASLIKYVGEFDRPYQPLRLWAYRWVVPLARRALLKRSDKPRDADGVRQDAD